VPRTASGVELGEGVSGHAAHLAGPGAALLQYNVFESSGRTNLSCANGTVRFWFRADWNSGAGPGTYARLIDVGVFTTDASYGWWSLYLDPAGTNLFFSAQANGNGTNFLSTDVQWPTNEWHQIALTYSPTTSVAYLDGIPVAEGTGVTILPSVAVQLATGFAVGSDATGGQVAWGTFDELAPYNYPLSAEEVAGDYAATALLFGVGNFSGNSLSPPGFDEGGGDFEPSDFPPAYQGLSGSTNLSIEIMGGVSNTATLLLHNSPEISADDAIKFR
jgi:hypothetical protein